MSHTLLLLTAQFAVMANSSHAQQLAGGQHNMTLGSHLQGNGSRMLNSTHMLNSTNGTMPGRWTFRHLP